jgi:hypothetical protein
VTFVHCDSAEIRFRSFLGDTIPLTSKELSLLSKRLPPGVLILCAAVLAVSGTSQAQAPSSLPSTGAHAVVSNGAGVTQSGVSRSPVPAAPLARLNFSANGTSQHDSTTGWANIVTSDLSFRFNRYFSVDANVPWYLTLQAYVPTTVNGVTTYSLKQIHDVMGDATSSGRFEASSEDFGYKSAITVGYATGNSQYGIGAKSTTYNFNNHLEYSVGPFTPDVEIGVGNSSALTNHFVRKAYTAVGELANFQAGTSIDLTKKVSLDVEAYESMPVSIQSVFGTIERAGKNGRARGKQVLQGTGTAEDNGFSAELSIPLTSNLALSGQYNRSLRQASDIAGVSITWTLHAPEKREAGTPACSVARRGCS